VLFFHGNDDLGSISCDLTDHPGTARFYAVLRDVRGRPEVHDVRIGISKSWAKASGRPSSRCAAADDG